MMEHVYKPVMEIWNHNWYKKYLDYYNWYNEEWEIMNIWGLYQLGIPWHSHYHWCGWNIMG